MRANSRAVPVACGVLAAGVYFMTAAPGLSWANHGGDGGELVTAAVTLGVPHPPGYPTYVLLGKLISLVPFGSVAFRFNLFSAVGVAIAAAFVTDLSYHILSSRKGKEARKSVVPSAAAGLAFAFAPMVWGQATIAEVYGLNLAFLSAFLWSLFRERPAWVVGLLLGASITTHLTSVLMLPMALYLTDRRQWGRIAMGVVFGLSPYGSIPLLARSDSPVIWGSAETLDGWWRLVTGRIYSGNVMAVRGLQLGERLWEWIPEIGIQFTLAGPVLLAAAIIRAVSRRDRRVLALTASASFYFIYAAGYQSSDAIVFALPAILLLAAVLAFGLGALGRWSLLLPLIMLLINFDRNDLSHDAGLGQQAEAVLQSAPHNAVLLTPGDATVFALWYFRHIEGVREDLTVVDSNLFAFEWYRQRLGERHPELLALARDELVAFQSINSTRVPVCEVRLIRNAEAYEHESSCVKEAL